MRQFMIENKTVSVYPSKEKDRPIVYLNTYADNADQIYKAFEKHTCTDFTLAVISRLNWDHDMAPWDIPPVSEKDTPCTGGADDYLQLLTEKVVPETERELPGTVLWRGLAGYSLAGLFAFYSLYQTDLFSRIASISGSLWFPGFSEYVLSHEMKKTPDCLYLSLGDQERKTRNPYLRTVQERTEQIAAFCQSKGIDLFFQMNQGNHFQNGIERTVSGIKWILGKRRYGGV